jgi:hypothetical protein
MTCSLGDVDTATDGRLHYRVLAGEHTGQSGVCEQDEFRQWARFEVVPQGSGRWLKAP